jgi:hypothetical protein
MGSPEHHPGSLRGWWWFLRGVLVVFCHNEYCHNPTNNPKQLKTTFVGVVLLSVRKNHHHHHHHHGVITFKAVLGNPGSCFLGCNLILTHLDDILKTTSFFSRMEDNLNFFKKEEDLNFFKMESTSIFSKWKKT